MVVAFALMSSPALAQHQGLYLGFGFGKSEAKDACDGAAAFGIQCDDSDTATKFFGGYQFNRNFALEAGYTDLGRARFTGPGGTIDFESSGFELVAVGIVPLGAQAWLYGKAGLFLWDLDVSLVDLSESGTELTYGFGLGFDFTRNFAARFEYQVYPDIGDDFTTGTSDVTVLGVNLLFRF
jgi:OOP family OmpA-OmpF porin